MCIYLHRYQLFYIINYFSLIIVYTTNNNICLFYYFSLVHDVLSDEESTTEAKINKNVDTNNAFNVFSVSDDDQNEPKNK